MKKTPPENSDASKKYETMAREVVRFAQRESSSMEMVLFRNDMKVRGFKTADFNQIYKDVHSKYLQNKKENERIRDKESEKRKLRTVSVNLLDIHNKLKHITSTAGDLIEVVLAVIISVRTSLVNGLPLVWAFIVDVPSGDKTFHLEACKKAPFIVSRDSVTPGAFGSGYVDPKTGKAPDSDFLKELNRNSFIIKDLSALFSARDEKVKEFIGSMTNIYDQAYKKQTGTLGETGAEECAFSHLAGITDEALNSHQRYISLLGPRYFITRQKPLSAEQEANGFNLLWKGFRLKKAKEDFRVACSAFSIQLYEKPDPCFIESSMDEQDRRYVELLARLLSRLRAFCRRDDGSYKKQIEKPFRAMQQLRAMGISLAIVHGRNRLTAHEKELLRRIVLSSGPNDRVKVLELYRGRQADFKLTVCQCQSGIGRAYTTAYSILEELAALEILEKFSFESTEVADAKDKCYWLPKQEFNAIITAPYVDLDHIADLGNRAVSQNIPPTI